jgi:tripartite-type tricarboxylate transporter receptor subunit TctC
MKPSKTPKSQFTIAVILLVLAASNAAAQAYPSRPIRLVVPFPPGGTSEVIARPIAQRLTEQMGQSVVIDNRPGATGTIGAGIVAKAQPDGYTLLLGTTNEMCMSPGLYAKLPYDPIKDFSPITNIIRFHNVLVVQPSLSAGSVNELIALGRTRRLAFSSSGSGSHNHLSAELFKSVAHIDINHVPYKGGGPAMVAVMAGEVQAMFAPIPPAIGLIKAGKLKPMFITSHKRSAALADVMSADEAGMPTVIVVTWNGVFAPARTPEAILDRLNGEIVKAANIPDLKEKMDAQAVEMATTSRAEFAAIVREDCDKWMRVVKQAGIRAD